MLLCPDLTIEYRQVVKMLEMAVLAERAQCCTSTQKELILLTIEYAPVFRDCIASRSSKPWWRDVEHSRRPRAF